MRQIRLHTCNLCTVVVLRVIEDRTLKRNLDMAPLEAMNEANEGKN